MCKIVVAFMAFMFVAADKESDAVKKELAKLDGEWTMVSGVRDGQALPEDFAKTGTRSAKDGVTTVKIGDMLLMKAKVSVDPGKKPKSIDYDVHEGANKGKKQLGIYELDGDTIKFCFAQPDKDRPKEFASKEGAGHTLSVWKRKKE